MSHPKLSINQATIKYANLADALSATVEGGVEAIGLRSGGVSAERLLAAGAAAVHAGPRDLLEHLGEGLL